MGIRFVQAWDMGRTDMGAHWVREGSRGDRDDTLDCLMQVDHVVRVMDDGTVTDTVVGVYAPEGYIETDEDGQILDEHEKDFIARLKREGWTVEYGWSGQNSGRYDGPVMDGAEFIGAGLAEHIITTPGFWVAVSVTTLDNDDADLTWAVMHRPVVHYGETRTACGEDMDENAECVTDIPRVNCAACRTAVHKTV